MKPTHSRSNTSGSVISALVLAVVSLSIIGLLGGMGLAFMGGAIKHNNADAADATASRSAPVAAAIPAPVPAPAPAPAPQADTGKPAGEKKTDAPAAAAGAATEIEIGTHAMQFLFLVTEFTVKSGGAVKINFKNTSTQVPQPHNLVICKPGKKAAVEALAMQLMTDPNAMAKGYIPESEDIFAHTGLIQPGQAEILEFTAPEPGTYDYVCTFPGHWILMKGVMTVN